MTALTWSLVAVVAGGTAAGDVLQSAAMKRHGEIRDFRPGALGRVLGSVARDWRIAGAISFYAVAFFTLMRLLSLAPVSVAVPATAASYVLDTLFARYLLGEYVAWRRWAGSALVACGVAILSM